MATSLEASGGTFSVLKVKVKNMGGGVPGGNFFSRGDFSKKCGLVDPPLK